MLAGSLGRDDHMGGLDGEALGTVGRNRVAEIGMLGHVRSRKEDPGTVPLSLIGTRSALVLIREVFFGATRFEDLVNRSGLSEAVAAGRLKDLVTHGVLTRRPYRDPGSRTRQEYVLTDLGSRMFPVLVSMIEWGELLNDDHHTGVELIHKQCGSPIKTEITCNNDHSVTLDDTAVRLKSEPRTTP